ncbi:MAG TPA: outer membrane protein assembly factor BamE [Rhodopila sp.]|jgi:outer membrane protein assembly factor BamE (lipoprotein component of BamABCDE complex)|nr:outer membrane protein assembly factor BamE [Rhodopila sp.]
MSTRSRPSGLCRLLLISCLFLSSCGWLLPPPVLRGNKVDPESMKELTIGTSTKADVTAIIGSPTARDTFDDNTWLYITEVTQQRIGEVLGEIDQGVVVLKFDDKSVLTSIDKLNKDASISAPMIARTTASPGTEASFMQQLLGNIGRFNPAGGMSPSNSAPGGGAPSTGLGAVQ